MNISDFGVVELSQDETVRIDGGWTPILLGVVFVVILAVDVLT